MRSQLKPILLFTFAVLLIWWFARDLDWARVAADLRAADWRMILAAVMLISLTYLLRALRWREFLRPLTGAHDPGLRDLFAATTVGFGALFLIGRAGEVARPAFLSLTDRRIRPAAAFMTIFVERIYDMAAMVVLFSAALLFVRAPEANAAQFQLVRKAGVLLIVGAILGVACLVAWRRLAPAIERWLVRRFTGRAGIVARVGRILAGLTRQLAAALGVLTNRRALVVTVGWTALLWGAIALANYLVLRAFDLQVGLAGALFVLGWSLVGSLVPTPGGAAGAYHGAIALGLAFLGVRGEQAAATAIIQHLVMFTPAVFLGVYYFARSDVRWRRLQQAADDGMDEAVIEESSAAENDAPRHSREAPVRA